MRWPRIFVAVLATLAVLLLVALISLPLALRLGKTPLENWTRSPGFQELISREVSKSMKVDGTFGPIMVTGMEARTPSYTSTGWPGEAIGSLDASGIHAVFNPWAILRRVWQVDRITIDHGTFVLRPPVDALKRPRVAGPKPWYALFMPVRFYCPEIICPMARVEFPFQGQTGVLEDLNLRARMIGRDFEYRADAGRVRFPLFPVMRVEDLDLFLTREKVDIRKARLAGLDGDPGRVFLSGRIGMREDRSIRARVEVDQLPFGQALPTEWLQKLDGRLTGKLAWDTDAGGLKTSSDGEVKLENVEIRGWSWLENLARVHDNEDLKTIRVSRAKCSFAFDGKTFRIRHLDADAGELLGLSGEVDHEAQTKQTRANLTLDHFDLKRWLPSDFKPRVDARGTGSVFWEGSWKEPLESRASGSLHLPACRYRLRPFVMALLQRYDVHLPPQIDWETVDLNFTQAGRRFDVTHLGLKAQHGLTVEAYGHWVMDQAWELNLDLQGLDAGYWRPRKGDGRVAGRVSLTGQWSSASARLEDGSGTARVRLEGARFQEFAFQKTLARFLKRKEVRDLRFEQFEFAGTGDTKRLKIERLRLFSPGKIGLEGNLDVAAEGPLSGTVWVGLPASWLGWLPEAETTVFTRKKEGLCWARVRISGTMEKMEQDLTGQILKTLRRHPLALADLGVRALSWWLGDALGLYSEP
ncbi:MAG: hypothetical protein SFU85_11560 [Candidatus Methylacidiphilales bacterium]|nr:hypothetical protein [Candidatus Methylacidiphilales bacterium]